MKILIYSPLFYPSVGGTETVLSILAHELIAQGHEVKVVTQTPAVQIDTFPFEVIRKPNFRQLLHLTRWCEIYFQGNVSLKGLWSLLFVRRPLVVTHQTWYCRPDERLGWQDHLKRFITRFATNISASHAVAEQFQAPSTVIPNPYREDIFYKMPEIERNQEIVFLGRLVSDKGADLLLDAVANLKALELKPRLTMVGSGPEESKLRQQAQQLNIDEQVNFAGLKLEKELAQILNAHQILIVPSRWREPFGIVALEGIACGCVVVGSAGGGLKDAIGSCGVTFPNRDVKALTQVLFELLTNPDKLSFYTREAEVHLSRHTRAAIAKEYIKVFERAIR